MFVDFFKIRFAKITFVKLSLWLLLVSLLPSVFLTAQANEEGKALYQQCVACHGDSGQGNSAIKAPALAGQFNWYLTRQLSNFSKGLRGQHQKDNLGQQMLGIANALDFDKDVPLLSDYLSSLATSNHDGDKDHQTGVLDENYDSHKNGSRYYQAKCGACHGGQAQGNKSFNAPKLSGLSAEYLTRQMSNFSKGIRGTEPADKFGRQMAMMAKTTSGMQLEDIIFYISTQPTVEKAGKGK